MSWHEERNKRLENRKALNGSSHENVSFGFLKAQSFLNDDFKLNFIGAIRNPCHPQIESLDYQ